MSEKDVEIFEHFLNKPSMWIHPVNKSTIVSFINGFEAGINNKEFTEKLKLHIESKYDVFGSNQGWPNQISIISSNKNEHWNEVFKEIGLHILKIRNL